MTKKNRHQIAVIGFAALAVLLFGILAWAIIEGAVVESYPGGTSTRSGGISSNFLFNAVHTREGNPGRYWLAVGLLGFWGTLFTLLAAVEYGSYRSEPDSPEQGEAEPRHDPQLISRRQLRRQQEDRNRQRQQAKALDPIVKAALDSVVRSFNSRLQMSGIGWLEIPDSLLPRQRSFYVVFPALSDLDKPAVKAADIEGSVREALRQQGYPDELLGHVSIHRTSIELVSGSFGSDALSQINQLWQ